MSLLTIDNLSISLPVGSERQHAVEQVSLAVSEGKTTCVVGRSGSGKSVLAQAVMGLLPTTLSHTAGSIRLSCKSLPFLNDKKMRPFRASQLAMIFQDPMAALNPLMTIGDQIAEATVSRGALRRAEILDLLAEVDLPDPVQLVRRYPFQLSGGQRQRVMIAIAIARRPALLVADEPTTALDVLTQATVLALLKRLQETRNMGVLLITHDFGIVADVADEVVVLNAGRLVEQGAASELLANPREVYTQQLLKLARIETRAESPPRLKDMEGNVDLRLRVRNLSRQFDQRGGFFRGARSTKAVDRINFELRSGETLGLVGGSGSGKSTVGRCILRLSKPSKGEVFVDGVDIAGMTERSLQRFRPHLQMIFQDPTASLNPRHPVGWVIQRDLQRAFRMTAPAARRRVLDIFTMVQLDPQSVDRLPHAFSGGQRQRICLARALALEPKILVADEAVSALDVATQADMIDLLKCLQERLRFSVLFITHDLRLAARICDRLIVLESGRIVEEGTPMNIFDRPRHAYTKKLLGAVPGQNFMRRIPPTAMAPATA
ncbi:ABC transporter ATP-binding protein [Bradyrhizobium prioriisuperbiae]|uniref:ABC transporter ATP-binding protein n=1 Tax=Bradyrhizobium prioriisuperbiae TaxID=2854389 RepID=UPI0028EEAB27|nr:ABC transporter ATP-binding protein [Bradyrhizobium prioritasuperba]